MQLLHSLSINVPKLLYSFIAWKEKTITLQKQGIYFVTDHETCNDNEASSAIYDIKALKDFLILALVFGSI